MKKFIQPFLTIVFALLVWGFAVPSLINAPHTFLVIIGFCGAIASAFLLCIAIVDIAKILKTSKDQK